MRSIEKFIDLLEKEQFEEAHEALEPDWLEFKKNGQKEKALFYKGLINGATSIALIIRKRSERAKTITWEAFLKYQNYIDVVDSNEKAFYEKAISLIIEKRIKYL